MNLRRSFPLGIISIILVALAAAMLLRSLSGEDAWICTGGQWVKHGNPSAPAPTGGCGDLNPSTQDNFDRIGNLIKDNPGLTPGVWYLSYEMPGKPGLSASLAFKDGAPLPLSVGDRVRVRGAEASGTVAVREITKVLRLYYYHADLDKDASGTVTCGDSGIVPVEREVAVDRSSVSDVIGLLIKGELTDAEKAEGISTEYPLPGFALAGSSLKDGTLTLTFADPMSRSSGGSCRAKILWLQIANTAKQFPGVTSVKFSPSDLFQP